ncbi:DNA polymerase I [Aurantimicrobium sp. MWH-Uga1]|uniref:DNA polymerase I n=1 Tax=Aurantimicrobium sp. MWH-Uga1 TaxID=2079575 RepID=UPI000DEDE2CA|nr:DNA polymerase I [Aurantimicrobium sp. MWH-Uga1]AXE54519.1 DNA polymerase I [Aurantimicrobium sp. MWH-Uga1]
MSNTAQPTLMVIDGHSLAFRAFYALPVDSFKTADGQHTNAIHGFISMMLNLLAKEKPTHLAVAFDISRFSFRTREYPEYKGTRGETPPEFIGQVPLLQDALHAMGITTLTKEDFEADDILATLAAQGSAQNYKVLVVSGDRDTIQLIDDNVTLLYPSKQGVSELTRYDATKVFERYGIQPHQYPEIAALVGETSDNLPGVPKVGEKTAVKWINEYGSLDEILRRADEIGGKVGESLREYKDNAIRNRKLNRLVSDVDLPVGPADLERQPFDVEAVKDVFGRLEFKSLLTRVLTLAGETDGTPRQASPVTPSQNSQPALSPVTPSSPINDAIPPRSQQILDEELAAWLHRASDSSPQGIAVEVEVYASGIASVGLATENETVLVPWSPVLADIQPLIDWLASPTPKIFHGAKEQLKTLFAAGVVFESLGFDTEIADWVLRPDSSKRELGDLAKLYLNEILPEPDPNQLVPDDSALDVAGRAWFIRRIDEAIRSVMDAATLALFLEIELPTLTTLAAMELRGITVNKAKLENLSRELGDRAEKAKQEAFAVIGREVNLASPKQLQEVLFDQLGMPKTRATKTGYTTDATALADLQATNPHPFLGLLLEHRDVTKLKQIVETLIQAIGPDGRIHTTYGQTGTSTGRLSSANPNLQNIPIRTADGRRIREAFEVGDGFDTLFTADYSQIEMRIMAHFSEDEGLIEAFISGEDLHRFVGARVFGVRPADVTSDMRSQVKAMSYGLAYGLSAFGLARQLGIDNSAAKKLMADYFQRFGGVRDYLRSVVEEARAQGYTQTLFGRRRPFPDLTSPNRVLRDNAERAALNAPMQGTAADIMKIAMIGIEQDLEALNLKSQLLLQVHDELVLEIVESEREQVEKIVVDRMSHAAKLSVPLDVQIGLGHNWNAAAH